MARDLAIDLHTAVGFELYHGKAFGLAAQLEPLAVVSDPELTHRLLGALATKWHEHQRIVPADAELMLGFTDADGQGLMPRVHLLGSWLRVDGRLSDGRLIDGSTMYQILDQIAPDRPRPSIAVRRAEDRIEPFFAAAGLRDQTDRAEHAVAIAGGSLCGLAAADIVVYRHGFLSRPSDCASCADLIWTVPDGRAIQRAAAPADLKRPVSLSAQWDKQMAGQPTDRARASIK